MTIYGSFHPRADVDRLYVSGKKGRRGLMPLMIIQLRYCADRRTKSQSVHYKHYSDEEFLDSNSEGMFGQ